MPICKASAPFVAKVSSGLLEGDRTTKPKGDGRSLQAPLLTKTSKAAYKRSWNQNEARPTVLQCTLSRPWRRDDSRSREQRGHAVRLEKHELIAGLPATEV